MTLPHPINKIKQSDFYKKFKTAIFTSFVITLFFAGVYVFKVYADASVLQRLEYGTYSVSINERYELTVLNRNLGKPIVYDSTLTRAIFYQLSNRYYSETNKRILNSNE